MQVAMVAGDIAKWLSFGQCWVKRITGRNNQNSDLYIQLHEVSQGIVANAQVQPANGTVPRFKGLLAQQSNNFVYDFDGNGLDFAELVVCVSTTEPNLTIVGANGGLDMTIELDGRYLVSQFPNLTVVGDLSTSQSLLQIWAEAATPRILVRVDAEKVSGSSNFVVYYAVDTPASTSKVIGYLKLGDSSTVVQNNHGQGFGHIMQVNPDFTLHTGLSLQTQSVQTAEAAEGINAKIRAMYI